jgi:hypothetical protein
VSDDPSSGSAKPGEAEKAVSRDGSDVVVLGKPTPDGEGVTVLRLRQGNAELGQLQPLKQGKPIVGEVVTLRPRPEHPAVCDVEVEVDARPQAQANARPGPPQVATDRYRDGWDAIWSKKPEPS